MSRQQWPRLPYIPRLDAIKLRQSIRKNKNFTTKHECSPVQELTYLLDVINAGGYDWEPSSHRPYLDTNAVRQYLKRGIKYCQSFPERVSAPEQLQRLLDDVDAGRFTPRRQEPRTRPETVEPSQVPQIALNTSQWGAQSLSEGVVTAKRITHGVIRAQNIESGVIDTDEMESW